MAGTTFTFDNELPTARDYARARLDDTNADDVLLYDEQYDALMSRFGEQEGMALAASMIAVIISKKLTAYGESAGIRYTKKNLAYYQELPDLIRLEQPYSQELVNPAVKVGEIKQGATDYDSYRYYRRFEGWPAPCKEPPCKEPPCKWPK